MGASGSRIEACLMRLDNKDNNMNNKYNNELAEVAEDSKFLAQLAVAVLTVGLLAVAVYMMVHVQNTDVCAQIVGNCTFIR